MLGSGLYLRVYESGRTYLAGTRGKDVKEEDLFWESILKRRF